MEPKGNAFIVGLFVLVLSIGTMGFVAWYGTHREAQDYTIYRTYFPESVAGLAEGSAVRYRGIQVGTVQTIELDPENVERARVTMQIARTTPVKTDTVATLRFQGITGVLFIELSGGTQQATALETKEGEYCPVIPSQPSQLERVFSDAPDLIAEFALVGNQINELLNEDNQEALRQTLLNLASITGSIANNQKELDRFVRNSADTMANFSALSLELRRSGPDAVKLTRSLRRTSDETESLVRDLEQNPSQILFGGQEDGVKVP